MHEGSTPADQKGRRNTGKIDRVTRCMPLNADAAVGSHDMDLRHTSVFARARCEVVPTTVDTIGRGGRTERSILRLGAQG